MDEPNQKRRSAASIDAADETQVSTRGHWVLSLTFVAAAAVGFWLFSSGFLLMRSVLSDHSSASVLPFTRAGSGTGYDTAFDSGSGSASGSGSGSETGSRSAAGSRNTTKNDSGKDGGSVCGWYPAKFERAVVLVIDAMRIDFATWSDELGAPDSSSNSTGSSSARQQATDIRPKPYHNRMTVIDALSRRFPDQTMLYRFRADPPTTTLQRLKGLTTGQLPTFIDAGSNFAGSAISEDNWLQAMRWPSLNACDGPGSGETKPGETKPSGRRRRYRRNVVFLGDDTWMSLFPGELSDTHAMETNDTLWMSFSEAQAKAEVGAEAGVDADAESGSSASGRHGWARVRPFPSLNVWDLDTVDDGVLSRLPMFLLPPAPIDGADEDPEISVERRLWRSLVRQPAMLGHSDFGAADSPDNTMVSKNVGAEQLHRDWDVVVAHGLGVDHCGHRFGPDHPAISQKLDQMNRAIELIVQAINRSDKRTALFVFGDHGMDPKGDHGGDSPREVDAALWVYANTQWKTKESSKRVGRVLEAAEAVLDSVSLGSSLDSDLRSSWWRNTHLSDEYRGSDGALRIEVPRLRSVPQIDLVPTLSLALGLHIPFNNLGAAIPEFFAADVAGPYIEWGLLRAVRLNAAQTMRYLETYMRSTASHGFSDEAVLAWRDMYARAETSYRELRDLTAHSASAHQQPHIMQFEESVAAQYYAFLRVVLGTLRQLWAQFDAVLIVAGLLVFVALLAALAALVVALRYETPDQIVARVWKTSVGSGVAGAIVARSVGHLLNSKAVTDVSQHEALAAGFVLALVAAFTAALVTGLGCNSKNSSKNSTSISISTGTGNRISGTVWALNGVAALTAVVHGLAFTSNSFTFREDGIVLYLAQTLAAALALAAVKSMRASASEQQRAAGIRALACSVAILVLNRVSSYSTVCREEQLPGCTPTFYGQPSASISSIPLATANAAMVWLVPFVVRRFLRRSHSDQAMISRLWVSVGMRASMGMAALYWVLDSVDSMLASGMAGNGAPGASPVGSTAAAEAAAEGASSVISLTSGSSGSDWSDLRIVLARMAVGVALGGGLAAWLASPFCIDVAVTSPAAAATRSSEVLPT
ncbi:mannose-ethanolamine phosphotransferase gpi13, partial [Coemansia asiatica]